MFQLTAPLREPTSLVRPQAYDVLFQLTAPLREPTGPITDVTDNMLVSTHGSLAGADLRGRLQNNNYTRFQLTAPLREPTIAPGFPLAALSHVSTHGSLAGADL